MHERPLDKVEAFDDFFKKFHNDQSDFGQIHQITVLSINSNSVLRIHPKTTDSETVRQIAKNLSNKKSSGLDCVTDIELVLRF